ncbi:MAG: hypothetical protein L7S67_09420 [Flavobacteriales bacterium]|nr:hypothetical protein [Flavobacteriales bacterium]
MGVLLIGLLAQALLGILGHAQADDAGAAAGLAARYSGRLSFLVYLSVVLALIMWHRDASRWRGAFLLSAGFAWAHLLHFGYLTHNLILNGIAPEVPKAIGGALAYALIVAHPVLMLRRRPEQAWHPVYVFYVGLVMGLTFLARYRGEFPGAEPEPAHLLGMGLVAVAFLVYAHQRFVRRPEPRQR